ncbi:hypothetical protein, partial [Aeromonas salmonicida]
GPLFAGFLTGKDACKTILAGSGHPLNSGCWRVQCLAGEQRRGVRNKKRPIAMMGLRLAQEPDG